MEVGGAGREGVAAAVVGSRCDRAVVAGRAGMSVAAAATKVDVEYTIKPEAVTPAVDTSTWPLLLKDYDKCRSPSSSTSSSSSSRVFGLNCCFFFCLRWLRVGD